MKTYDLIENAIKNIEYNADRIEQLTREQFEEDCNKCEVITDNTNRLDILACMGSAANEIKLRCIQLTTNLQHARDIKVTYKPGQEVLF